MNLEDVKEAWKRHIDFPAMVGFGTIPTQIYVETYEDFERMMLRNLDKDAYASAHNVKDRKKSMYNCIYFDMDNSDLEIARQDTLLIYNYFKERNIPSRVYFSANKGFHIYIDFVYTKIEDYSKRMDYFLKLIHKKFPQITSIDDKVCKDANRILRIPYTINTKSDKLCVPIDPNSMKIVKNVKRYSKKFIKQFMKMKIPEVKHKRVVNVSSAFDYVMENAESFKDNRKNIVWKIIVPACIQLGYKDNEIMATCKEFYIKAYGKFTHANENFVRSQINVTRKNDIFPMGLQRFLNEYKCL